MADCSYSRCVQERRNIRRELQKWTKNMVYIVGLERIAEELMGRRKWKLYQECMSRSQHQQQLPINNNVLDSKVKQEIVENDEQERLKDWSPQSKCYFCVDGKLDSDHTTHGALSPRPSDSESSDSPSDSEAPPTLTPSLHLLKSSVRHGHVGSRHPGAGAMTSLVPPAAAAAAAAGLPFYPPLFAGAPNWYLSSLARNLQHHQQQQQQQQQRELDVDKVGVGVGVATVTEQPLDLSAKPGNSTVHTNPSRLPAIDTKHIFNCDFRAKPRMSAVSGRRTYTEEELQAALRDIQSGKLGTRRAAVIYGIPRSTLRNKVYKLAMERERESHLAPLASLADEDVMDDERELSGAEEEKEVEKALQGPLLSMADIVRFADQQQLKSGNGKEETWTTLEHSALGPYIQLMMAEQLAGKEPSLMPVLPELMRKIISDEQHVNNGEIDGKSQPLPPPPPQPSPSNSIKVKTDSSDMDTDDSPANVILKIPSFKPTTSKNGGDVYRSETDAMVSPPVTSESGSPPIGSGSMLSLREAIAKSISQKFQQSPGAEPLTRHSAPMEIDYKRVGITPPLAGLPPVIKNHHHHQQPQVVAPEPATPPAGASPAGLSHARSFQSQTVVVNNNSTKSHAPPNNNNAGSGGATQGGKGTRPKRGKYRNYDRDSLVEAVRAVQRGEMSVHRAGSYYGVPHSTLEYKVKERHLMRPRKRDPKPNPVDEKIASMKSQEIRNIPDKMKPVIKPPQKFPPTSPNGMKMPAMFDPAMAPLGYTPPPFPFWPHPSSFPHLPLDYPRTPSTSQFPTSPDFFASQMMQQLQERSVRCHGDGTGAAATAGANGNNNAGLAKSAREMAESLYDGTGANGSFLDGIIRSSLESGVPSAVDKATNKEDTKNMAPENMSNKALLDQLCRNSRINPLSKPTNTERENSSGDESYRKVTSPINFTTKNVAEQQEVNSDDIQTIELSNDSNESASASAKEDETTSVSAPSKESPPSRIYVKPQFQELTKPENLKPEVLVRFRTATDESNAESNGLNVVLDTESASDLPDAAQD